MTGFSVRTHGLDLAYGGTPAVADVSLDLEPNRIHGLLGRNGAGKTTLLSALASLRPPSGGSVAIEGTDPFENEQMMELVCLIRESGDVIPDEKLSTNLDWAELARPTFDRAYAERLVDDFGLNRKKKPQALSRGQASAFGVVVGLASRSPLTMFDEVHLGMDAPARQHFYDELLRDFAEHPRTIILSSHLINEIETMLETVTILHGGRLLLSEEADELRVRGATLTGATAVVDRLTAGQSVIGTRDLGPTRQVTLFGDLDPELLDSAGRAGVQVGPVPLQDLFIHLTNHQAALTQEGS
jgi:ABC-2 type transport system ATP-binding protein